MSAPQRESVVEAFLHKRVRALGGHTVKISPLEAGVPDRLVMLPGGRMYLVELKTVTGRLRPIQAAWHTRAARMGITVHVVHGTEGVREWLRVITEALWMESRQAHLRALRAGLTPVVDDEEQTG